MLKRFAGTAKKLTPMQLEDLLSDGTTTKYWLVRGNWIYPLLYSAVAVARMALNGFSVTRIMFFYGAYR